ncbi:MAG: DUF4428 domain-containing protein [Clostridia bacterium]|nr:DUF4428 domain-containing protein [Clostridia bacterium]
MGFFKNLFSKQVCELCGKEVGALSRSKLKDDKYVCYDCCKNCSSFYPTTRYTLEEVKKHMDYMENMNKFCTEVFDKIEDKKDFALMFQKTGIKLADEVGMFEIITSNTKKKNYRELFRYDQIWDYKLYGVENTGENQNKKYSETGVKIKMICKLDNDPAINVTNQYDEFKHEYAKEFTIPCAHNTDTLDGGFLLKHLDQIFGVTIEGKLGVFGPGTVGRTGYRTLNVVDMTFNRSHWKEVADNAEKNFFGKTLKED